MPLAIPDYLLKPKGLLFRIMTQRIKVQSTVDPWKAYSRTKLNMFYVYIVARNFNSDV